MKVDITEQLGLIRRGVIERQHLGRPARVVVATRSYDTSIADVWDAITNPERIARWFTPVTGELRLGGRYQLKGNAGGEVTACEPGRHFALTWEHGGEVSWVDVRLEEEHEARTRLRLEHIAHIGGDRWDQYGPGAVGVGWDLSLLGLDQHLGLGAGMDHAQGEAWLMSDAGKAFMRGSSERWGAAAEAAGAEPAVARAAAARTTAAYTGEAPPEGSAG